MAFGGFGGGGVGSQEVPLPSPIPDSVQSLAWSPAPSANHLVAGAWNGMVRTWEVNAQGQGKPMVEQKFERPVLDTQWTPNGQQVYVADCAGHLSLWDLASNQKKQIGAHAAPIKAVRACPSLGPTVCMTGSWDKTVKFWDGRQATAVASHDVGERVYAMDINQQLAVVATADRKVKIFRLQGSVAPYRETQSVLHKQTRCITCFPTQDGFCIGSIEGRVGVQHVDPSIEKEKNFSFKCHRDSALIHAVNDIKFHPTFGTFATCGSDGRFVYWDKDARNRLKEFSKSIQPVAGLPITSIGFNSTGNLFAYAHSYDWHKGHEHRPQPGGSDQIMIHLVQQNEIQKKAKR